MKENLALKVGKVQKTIQNLKPEDLKKNGSSGPTGQLLTYPLHWKCSKPIGKQE